ncbi:hypothetical protein ACFXKD_27710 [Nocardiopsis aegyptia]|uniref:hypothetical protein n=1 Tax=Nocardiopsis aegyptia TaxID=220378 RepID=UPI00366C3972
MSTDITPALMSRDDVLTIRWDRIVTRDDGTVWALCVADTGQPVALALDEEHAEALAGALLDGEDGEEVVHPSYRDGVRDALAAAAREVERAAGTTGPAALASAIRMMGTTGRLAQDGPVQVHNDDARIAELEAAREQLAAATWPTRAARRLADDARPTTEGSAT